MYSELWILSLQSLVRVQFNSSKQFAVCFDVFGGHWPTIPDITVKYILHCCVFQVGQTAGARGGDLQVLAAQLRR